MIKAIRTLVNKRWNTIKWLVKELVKVASNQKSFFSSKRIQQLIGFTSGEVTLLSFFFYNLSKLSTMDAIAIAAVFFTVAGYVLNKTEAAKKKYTEDGMDNSNLEETK